MRLKSFYATTMTEAMQMVRDTLGDDAVIVATQEERNGAVHVTAAVEPHFEISKDGMSSDWLQYDEEDEENAVAEELTEALLRHSASEDVIDNIVSCATVIGLDHPGQAMIEAVEHLFNFAPLPKQATQNAQMMVGSPGAGKTLAIAKMAARGTINGLKIGVISCDTVRAGGVEQLAAFTDLLKVPLKRAETPADLKAILADMRGFDQVLIDTPGVNPFDKNDIRTLARLIGAGDITPTMILPAGTDTDEAAEMARVFSTIGTQGVLPTRVDIARRLGGLLSAAHYGNLHFTDASHTPKVADGLFAMTPKDLSRMLMPGAFKAPTRRAPARRTAQTGRH